MILRLHFLSLFIFCCSFMVSGQNFGDADQWESLNPGGGGQIQDLYFDRQTEGRIWFSSDMEGIYRSDDFGQHWTHVSRDLVHGMSFTLLQEKNGSRMYQGGLYGANISDNAWTDHPLEVTWATIPITEGDAIASIGISSDDQMVVLAPGWQNKDPQKCQNAILEPVQDLASGKFNGVRNIYISHDAGMSWETAVYEQTPGYRHVFGVAVHPFSDDIYIGAASGVYRSQDQGASFQLIDAPENALRGAGDATNCNSRPDGGSRGLTIDASGKHLYAVYQTQGGSSYEDKRWEIFHANIHEDGTLGQWTKVMNNLTNTAEWYNPKVDPRSTATEQKLLIGTVWSNNANRVGLWEATINFDQQDELQQHSWEKIIEKPTKGANGNCFEFEVGWEERAFIVRAYDYAPKSWNAPAIVAMGGMNVFLGDPLADGFPCSAASWHEIYGEVIQSSATSHTMSRTRGFASPYAYDMDVYENYMLQGNADHGLLQSFDYGYSWTPEEGPQGVTNVMSVLTVPTESPMVLVDARKGFGAPSPTAGALYALKLNTEMLNDKSDWKLIGGAVPNGAGETQGLPSRNFRVMTHDSHQLGRVYVGTRGIAGTADGGIWVAEDIEAVYDGTQDWRKITPEALDGFDIRDVWVDPTDASYLFAAGHNTGANGRIFRGHRNDEGVFSWTILPDSFNRSTNDLYVWNRGNGQVWIAAITSINGHYGLYLNKNPYADNFDTAEAWEFTGFDAAKSLSIRPEKWAANSRTINIGGLAADGDHLVVCTMVNSHKKGLGVFLATVDQDSELQWSDWTFSGKNATAMPHAMTTQAKIIQENDRAVYYVATAGVGPWRRSLPQQNDCDILLTEDQLTFDAQGGTATIAVTSDEAFDFEVDHGFAKVEREGDQLTVEVEPYGGAITRHAVISVYGCQSKNIAIIQHGTASQGIETFGHLPDYAPWQRGVTFVGNHGVNWALEEVSRTSVIDGNTLRLRGQTGSGDNLTSAEIKGIIPIGFHTLKFQAQQNQMGDGRENGALEVYLNGTLLQTVEVPINQSAAEEFSWENLDMAAGTELKIVCVSNSKSPVHIDNITWIGEAPKVELTIENGSGSGYFSAGASVTVQADVAPEGLEFVGWEGATFILEDDPMNTTQTFTMPNRNIYLRARFEQPLTLFNLMVNRGAGSGQYEEGDEVAIRAETPLEGETFLAWSGDTDYVSDVNSAATTIVMPAQDISLTATYETLQFELSVTDGSGSGRYAVGAEVDIVADAAPEGEEFSHWSGDVEYLENSEAASTTLTMPAQAVAVEAIFEEIGQSYTLTVTDGSGSGRYAVGTEVAIVAEAAPEGTTFAHWSGDTDYVSDVNSAATTVVMPGQDIYLTATYEILQFELSVTDGSGSGNYAVGTEVAIVAIEAPEGQEFSHWSGDVEYLENSEAASTTLTMPAQAVAVEAIFEQIPLGSRQESSSKIYPNPAAGQFMFNASAAGGMLIIYNALGKTVASIQIQADRKPINVSHLPEGMYFVSFNGQIEKLLIKRD